MTKRNGLQFQVGFPRGLEQRWKEINARKGLKRKKLPWATMTSSNYRDPYLTSSCLSLGQGFLTLSCPKDLLWQSDEAHTLNYVFKCLKYIDLQRKLNQELFNKV